MARRAGTRDATTVTTVPTSSDTTMVRGSIWVAVLGRLKPTASIRKVSPLATRDAERQPDGRGEDAEQERLGDAGCA